MTDLDEQNQPALWHFSNATYDELRQKLTVNGNVVSLDPKPLEVLLCLLRANGELVTKDELHETVWNEHPVTESALSQAIKRLRNALSDQNRTLVRTVHGHGFRLDTLISCEYREETARPRSDSTTQPFQPGDVLAGAADWTLNSLIQSHGSTSLWLACTQSGQWSVFKVATSNRARKALQREVTLNRVLTTELGQDAGVVPILEAHVTETPGWIRMPHFKSGDLRQWLKSNERGESISLQNRIHLMSRVARTLSAAHQLGVIHKDIKPGNLLVEDTELGPRLLISDFGSSIATDLARLALAGVTIAGFTATQSTAEGHATGSADSGTPGYLAPEVVSGASFSEKADIYSFGVTLYQLASGRIGHPLAPGWEEDVADPALQKIIARACASRPEQRVATMNDLAALLEQWQPSKPTAPLSPTGHWQPEWSVFKASAALLLVGTALFAAKSFIPQGAQTSAAKLASSISPAKAVSSEAQPTVAFLPIDFSATDKSSITALQGMQQAALESLAIMLSGRPYQFDLLTADELKQKTPAELFELTGAQQVIAISAEDHDQKLSLSWALYDSQVSHPEKRGKVSGPETSLYELQKKLETALANALEPDLKLGSFSTVASASSGYTDHLEALAYYQQQGAYSRRTAKEFLRLIDKAITENPNRVSTHILAIRGAVDAFDSSALTYKQANSLVSESMASLEILGAPAPLLAYCESLIEMYLRWDAKTALNIVNPYWPDLQHLPYAQIFYANLLEANGEIAKLLSVLEDSVASIPTDLSSLDFLANFYFNEKKDPVKAMMLLSEAKNRLPDSAGLDGVLTLFGVFATGDREWIDRQLSDTASYPANSMAYLGPRMDDAFRRSDKEALLALAANLPEQGFKGGGSHCLQPNSLMKARALYAANASPSQIKNLSDHAQQVLANLRSQSDSPCRQMASAMALAYSGQTQAALELAQTAFSAWPREKNEHVYEALLFRAPTVFALANRSDLLLANLEELFGTNGLAQGDCWMLYKNFRSAPVWNSSAGRNWMQTQCEPWLKRNRAPLKRFLN